MAFPVILINSATGSDTVASGAGPATAITGTKGRTRNTASQVKVGFFEASAPDLSGIATDGSHVLYIPIATAGQRNFSSISAVKNVDHVDVGSINSGIAILSGIVSTSGWSEGSVLKVTGAGAAGADLFSTIFSVDSVNQVTLNDNAGTSVTAAVVRNPKQVTLTTGEELNTGATDTAWAIGGKRASIFGSVKLANNNNTSGDAMPGWIVRMESGHSESYGTAISWRRGGDTNGPITFEGVSGAATMPLLTFTANSNAMQATAAGVVIQDFEMRNSNASKTGSSAFNCAAVTVIRRLRINHSTNKFWKGILNTASASIAQCEIANCASHGIDLTQYYDVVNNYIYNNGGSGINIQSAGNNGVIQGNIITGNSGDGITSAVGASTATNPMLIDSNTIYNNSSDGIELAAASSGLRLYSNARIRNNIFANNGAYGINFSGASVTEGFLLACCMRLLANCFYGNSTDKANFSIANLSMNEVTTDPAFTNAGAGDFSVGANMRQLGNPIGASQTIGNAGLTRSYVDIGAAQRSEYDVADSTDPGVANVLSGAGTYKINSVVKTPTYSESARNTDPGESNVLTGTSYKILNAAKNGSFDESTRNTDPGVANVLSGAGTYKILNVTKTPTFDESARNTDPGVANVLSGAGTYKILNVTKTPTFNEAGRNTDPGAASVLSGTPYKILNSSKTGIFSEASRNTDPGVAKVLSGTNYKIHNVTLSGTLSVTMSGADYPADSDVRDGITFNFGMDTGNLEVPAVANVLSGVGFGSNGTEFTGIFSEASRNTDPGVANVLSGAGNYKILNVTKTPTFNEAARNTDPGEANVLSGAGTYKILNVTKTPTFNEAGRNTDPGVANVLSGAGNYKILNVTKTPTFNEAARNTDPGEANVLSGAGAYKILNVTKTPTFNEAARNIDPGIASVLSGTPYKIQNSSLTGTFSEASRNTDPGEASVLSGTPYKILNSVKNGSFSEASRNTDPGVANVLSSAGNYKILNVTKTPTFNEAARNTDPGEANVLSGAGTYKILNVTKTPTFNEAGRNTDPGVANVLSGAGNYKILNVTKTPTFNEAGRNTDPGEANVLSPVGYKILNAAKTGTFDESARNTDPGIANVKTGTGYKIQNTPLTGTLTVSGGGGTIASTGRTVKRTI